MANHYPRMRTRDEIREKLNNLYPAAINYERNFLDFHSGYQFFSNDNSSMLEFNSQWFDPKEILEFNNQNIIYERMKEGGVEKKIAVLEPKQTAKIDNMATINLGASNGASCQIEIGGEKFRVVYATLQKCSSPQKRRGFYFTSKGLIETPIVKKPVTLSPANMIGSKLVTSPSSPKVQKLLPLSKGKIIPKILVDTPEEHSALITNPFYENKIQKKKVPVYNKEESEVVINKPSAHRVNRFSPIQVTIKRNEAGFFTQTKEREVLISKKEAVSEETNRSSSPSTDTGDEEINPESFVEPTFSFERKEIQSKEQPQKESPSTFDCKECDKSFSSQQLLDEHVSSHQKESSVFPVKKVAVKKKLHEEKKSPLKKLCEEIKTQVKFSGSKSESTSSDDHVIATSKFGRRRSVLNIAKLRNSDKAL